LKRITGNKNKQREIIVFNHSFIPDKKVFEIINEALKNMMMYNWLF
jgi:hypothetical protein